MIPTPPSLSAGVPIDLPKLLETRALIQSNSGGGKSYCLRRVLETTAGHVQQLIVDPEGEFATLREKFDYIICSPAGGDAVANPATAAALARALWGAGISAVLDIYELKAHERTLFVKRFFDSLVNAPRTMWHPTLVVLDEIHVYAPQASQCESTGAVIDMATRGRKRGLSLLGATQRLSKLHKDVAAELLNKIIGRTGLDVDQTRAGDELGIVKREERIALRDLEPGQFFVFGPALTRAVTKTTIGPVVTTHPETGHRAMTAPPPPSKSVLAQLAKLEGIQREVKAEAHSMEEMAKEVANLRRKLTIAERERTAVGVSEAEVKRRIAQAIATQPVPVPVQPVADPALKKALQEIAKCAARALGATTEAPALVTVTTNSRADRAGAVAAPPKASAPASPPPMSGAGITGPEQRILDAVAWMTAIGVEDAPQAPVAFLARYTSGGGAYNNTRAKCKQRGLIEYTPSGGLRLTPAGSLIANFPAKPGTNAELHELIFAQLKGPARRMLAPLIDAYPEAMTNADLAIASGYTPNAGAYNNTRGQLRSFGLIDYPQPGSVVALPILFPR